MAARLAGPLPVAAALLLALLPAAAAAGSRAGRAGGRGLARSVLLAQAHARQGGGLGLGAEPADSATIEGPDCGHVKQIFGKWQKASKVGHLAGHARGVVSTAQAAAGALDAAAQRVRAVGAAIGENGTLPEAIKVAAQNADDASSAATAASAALGVELDTFKSAIASSDMSGAGVSDAQMSTLKQLTAAAENATQFAQAELKQVLATAVAAETKALKSSAATELLVKGALDAAAPLQKLAPEVVQKSGWAVKDAQAVVGEAQTLLARVVQKVANASEQAPVWEAAQGDLENKTQAVSGAGQTVTAAIGTLSSAADVLTNAVALLKAAEAKAAGGGVLSGLSGALTVAEQATAKTQEALTTLEGAVRTLTDRQVRLQGTMAQLEGKLA